MIPRRKLHCAVCYVVFLFSSVCLADDRFFDMHTHFNWDQAEVISAEQVITALRQQGVDRALITSTPNHLSAQLQSLAPELFVRFYSPYIHETGKRDWFIDKNLIAHARKELATGNYLGIGEIHFMAGFPPRLDNKNFQHLLQLAKQYQLPLLIHIDSANQQLFRRLCDNHPKLRFIFAHAGGNLRATHINELLQHCNNVWVDLSARDPWRYGKLTNQQGQLLAEWQQLLLTFPKRFFVGTDAVWRVTRTQSWDQADDGWDHFPRLMAFHQNWLAALPDELHHRLRWQNAAEFFDRKVQH